MISSFAAVLSRKDLLRVLVHTDLVASTARRKLGWLWWLIDPLLMMLIYWGIVVGLFGRGRVDYSPYGVFLFFGLLTWKQITQCVSKSCEVLRSHRNLIRSVPFPTIVLPLANLLSSFVLFLFGFGVLLLVAAIAPHPQHTGQWLAAVQLLPLFCLHLLVLSGIVFALSCYGLLFRDLGAFVPHALRVGFYLSPALFGPDLVQEALNERLSPLLAEQLYHLYMLNPFALLLTGYRASVFYGEWLPALHWVVLTLEAALSLWIGYRIYQHHDRRVIKFL